MKFIETLQDEIERRYERNARYSLRSFARDLGVDASNLSKILSGKFQPQKKTQVKILLKLGMKPSQIDRLLDDKENYFNATDSNHFLSTSKWYYDAILEITRLPRFKPSLKWIASELGLSETEVKIAVEKLKKLKLLSVEGSKWIDLSGNISTHAQTQLSNEAKKQKQAEILELSKASLGTYAIDVRDHSSTLLCIDSNDMQEVKELIKEFRQKMARFLERKEAKPDQVYQLQISFFPVTKVSKKGSSK